MSFFGLGGNLKVDVVLKTGTSPVASLPTDVASSDGSMALPPKESAPSTNQLPQPPAMIVPLEHHPSWRLRKNPFWKVGGPKQATVSPAPQLVGPDGQTLSNSSNQLYAFEASQNIAGCVILSLPPGKKADHLGIKIQFIGRIEMGHGVQDVGRVHFDFLSLTKELAPPGSVYSTRTELPFLFKNMDKEHESYSGRNVSVRYFVRVAVDRKFLPPIQKTQDVWVQIIGTEPPENQAIKMEVGIEDCLHIEFEYERRVYHLKDTILGKIHFLLVRIKIKHMELAVIRRETSGEGVAAANDPNASAATANQQAQSIFTETQTLIKYEIMDGAPVKGEIIPVRLFLGGIPADLTPTFTAVNNRFSVRYFLNLVLVDEEDRRYFKQQEIILWRKELG